MEDFRIDSIFDSNGDILDREMVNFDGTLFFIKLKEYITKEKLEVRDFLFRSNGRLAIWDSDLINVSMK